MPQQVQRSLDVVVVVKWQPGRDDVARRCLLRLPSLLVGNTASVKMNASSRSGTDMGRHHVFQTVVVVDFAFLAGRRGTVGHACCRFLKNAHQSNLKVFSASLDVPHNYAKLPSKFRVSKRAWHEMVAFATAIPTRKYVTCGDFGSVTFQLFAECCNNQTNLQQDYGDRFEGHTGLECDQVARRCENVFIFSL